MTGVGSNGGDGLVKLAAKEDEEGDAANELERLREQLEQEKAKVRQLQAGDVAAAAALPAPPPPSSGKGGKEGQLQALLQKAQQEVARLAEANAAAEAGKEELMEAMAQELEELEQQKEAEVTGLKSELLAVSRKPNIDQDALRAVVSQMRDAKRSLLQLETTVRDEMGELPKLTQKVALQVSSSVSRYLAKQAKGLQEEMTKLKRNYARELRERRRLFNLVQELRGNVRVYCRCRPPTQRELEDHATQSTICVSFPGEGAVELLNEKNRKKMWEFDAVFEPQLGQEDVYKEVSPLVQSSLDGYNVCIFAYGQTGSGKTYTMMGPPGNRGVNCRALCELFQKSQERKAEIHDDIAVSILEIYNEQIVDLLAEEVGSKKLEIRQGPHGNYVPDLTMVPVNTLEEVLKLMELGDVNRASACTNMNEHSSRSHLKLSVHITSTNLHTDAITRGNLHLIDLAGSERVGKSGAEGQVLKEALNINKSLSSLGDVIAARANKAGHVPFRNSTLTYLLQDSLSADSKTLMFVCISPVIYNADESSCSLNFASRVRTVELGKATRHVEHQRSISASVPLRTRKHL
ncbi:unnamed protein product [Chrysoparadoxa australica]